MVLYASSYGLHLSFAPPANPNYHARAGNRAREYAVIWGVISFVPPTYFGPMHVHVQISAFKLPVATALCAYLGMV